MKTVGERIQERLAEMGESQYWLADQVGIKQPSINALIKGEKAKGSKHLVPIANALGVHARWLWGGALPKLVGAPKEALMVGYIGAGAQINRPDEGVVLEGGIEPPAGYESALAAKIEGTSMYPLEAGWLIFYLEEHRGIREECINKLCAVGLEDGTVYVKKLRKAGKQFRLESWNADPIENAKVIWASRVIEIRPR